MMSTAAYAGGRFGWCVLIYGEGMLMRKGEGGGGLLSGSVVFIFATRH